MFYVKRARDVNGQFSKTSLSNTIKTCLSFGVNGV